MSGQAIFFSVVFGTGAVRVGRKLMVLSSYLL